MYQCHVNIHTIPPPVTEIKGNLSWFKVNYFKFDKKEYILYFTSSALATHHINFIRAYIRPPTLCPFLTQKKHCALFALCKDRAMPVEALIIQVPVEIPINLFVFWFEFWLICLLVVRLGPSSIGRFLMGSDWSVIVPIRIPINELRNYFFTLEIVKIWNI